MSAKLVKEAFGSVSLYSILQVDKTATSEQLKRAYYKAALRFHPDKQVGATAEAALEATKKFQALGFIHSLLSDSTRKAQYDRSGKLNDVDDEATEDVAAGAWYDYWRGFFAPVTEEAVLAFEKSYRGSDEEKADILRSYTSNKGDLDGILTEIMCCTEEDAPRFVKIIQAAIREGEVKAIKKFINEYGAGEEEEDNDDDDEKEEMGASASSSSKRADTGSGDGKKVKKSQSLKPTAKGMATAKRASTARAVNASKEALEADALLKDLREKFLAKKGASKTADTGAGGEPSLTDLLMANRESRQGRFSDILSRYETDGKKSKAKKGRGEDLMIEDDSKMEESGESPKRRARK